MRENLRRHLPLILVAMTAALVYAQTLSFDFVWDDFAVIVHNDNIRSLANAWRNFHQLNQNFDTQYDPSLLTTHNYRPIRTLVHTLIYQWRGADPFFYHLLNLLAHTATCSMLFIMLRRLSTGTAGALAGALFFAVHPVNTEAVCWAKSFEDLSAGFLLLLSLYLARKDGDSPRPWAAAGAIAVFALSLFTKESGFFLPLFLILYALFCSNPGENIKQRLKAARATWLIAGIMTLTVAAMLLWRHRVLGRTAQCDYITGDMFTTLLSMPRIFVRYVFLELLPLNLLADYETYPRASSLADPMAWFYVAVFAFLFVGSGYWLYRSRMSAGFLWFWCALLPFANIIPMMQLGAERFLYIPTIGAAWIVAQIVDRHRSAIWTWRLLIPLLACFAMLTVQRSRVWSNEMNLWTETVRQLPTATRPRENLVKAHIAAGNPDLALAHAETLLTLSAKPDHRVLYAYVLCRNGLYDKGLPILVSERAAKVLNIAGVDAIGDGRPDLALKCFEASMRLEPHNPKFVHNYRKLKAELEKLRNNK